jgi:spore maturation protein CgeB
MAADGFLSNRLFDAVATGARVVSDSAAGLEDVFGDAVVVFADEDHLVDILRVPVDDTFPSRDRRMEAARTIATEHSLDARAGVLIESVREFKGVR